MVKLYGDLLCHHYIATTNLCCDFNEISNAYDDILVWWYSCGDLVIDMLNQLCLWWKTCDIEWTSIVISEERPDECMNHDLVANHYKFVKDIFTALIILIHPLVIQQSDLEHGPHV